VSVAIITDSTASLPESLRLSHRIIVVPLHVVLGGQDYSEGVDLTPGQLAASLRKFTTVSTSRPSPQAFLDVYQAAAARGAEAVVSVHISSDMSGTVGSAVLAASQSPIPVEVVDSRSVGMAMGYAALSAAMAAQQGLGVKSVAAIASARARAATVIFYVDNLEHLRRGGRIGAASALLGSALAIKPLLALSDGRIDPIEKVRTAARALIRLEELAIGAAEAAAESGVDIAVHHLDSPARAVDLVKRLRARTPSSTSVILVELGAAVGSHVGPGTIAVAVSPRPETDGV
jgi:DegV family protein with EDD domain